MTRCDRRRIRAAVASGLVVVSLGVVTGCRRPQARTVPEMPGLDVPPPPPREIELVDAGPVLQPIPLIEAPARILPERGRVQPPREVRPEPPRAAEPPIIAKPPAEEPRPPAGPVLQSTPAGREDELERRIRALLTAASSDLGRVDARRLDPDLLNQYDTVKGFVRQAEEALKAKNLIFAETNANKAAVLAAQLAGR